MNNKEDIVRHIKKCEEYLDKIKEDYGEWLEMSEDPQELLICILFNKLAALQEESEYLEKRLEQFEKERQ